MTSFSFNVLSVNSLECVSINKQVCKVREEVINVNTNPVFYPVSFKVKQCSGSCKNINDPYAKSCVPNVVKKHKSKSIQFNTME